MAEDSALSALSASFIPALHKPSSLLPIARHRASLLYLIETFPVTIVVGQTGSGKTTQIPQFLESAGWCGEGKVVAVTQVCKLMGHGAYVEVAVGAENLTAAKSGSGKCRDQSGRRDEMQARRRGRLLDSI